MDNKILDILNSLDRSDDRCWTSDGLPAVDAVKHFAKDSSITREMINSAAPGYTRTTPVDKKEELVQMETPKISKQELLENLTRERDALTLRILEVTKEIDADIKDYKISPTVQMQEYKKHMEFLDSLPQDSKKSPIDMAYARRRNF